MPRNILTPVAVAALLAAVGPAHARSADAGLSVRDAWSRPAAAGTTGAGFMTIDNRGRRAEALVRVESPLARQVEIHRSTMSGGVMSMSPMGRLDVPAGGSATLAPGGSHLMLMGLSKTVGPGDHIPATLTFASGTKLRVDLEVRIAPPTAATHHH